MIVSFRHCLLITALATLPMMAHADPVSLTPRDQRMRASAPLNAEAPQYDVSLTTPRSSVPGAVNPWLGQPGQRLATYHDARAQAYQEQKAAAAVGNAGKPAPIAAIGGKVPPLTVYEDAPPLTGQYTNPWDRPMPPRNPVAPVTETSIELGAQFGYYFYKEPNLTQINGRDISIDLRGLKYGITGTFTGKLDDNWFVKADTRLTYGRVDYDGYLSNGTPLEVKGEHDALAEIRTMVGYDFVFDNWVIAPSLGLGYRFVYNDGTNVSPSAYGRDSNYLFLPIAIEPRVQFPNGDRLSLNLEYDHLIYGWQYSYLGDVNPGNPTLVNRQKDGYGLRGNLMYNRGKWSFGPYANYWNIASSERACDTGSGFILCGEEPHNYTVEFGIEARFRLY